MQTPKGRKELHVCAEEQGGPCDWIEPEYGDTRAEMVGETMKGLMDPCEDIGSYSEWNGEPLEGFEPRTDMRLLIFSNTHFGCWIENTL